jgi:hypothetical protein
MFTCSLCSLYLRDISQQHVTTTKAASREAGCNQNYAANQLRIIMDNSHETEKEGHFDDDEASATAERRATWQAKLSRIVKLVATGSSRDLFGLCPTCLNEEVTFLTIGYDVYFFCREHKFYWPNEEKGFRPWEAWIEGPEGRTPIEWTDDSPDGSHEYRELIASYTAVKPWRRPRWAWQLGILIGGLRHLIVDRLLEWNRRYGF